MLKQIIFVSICLFAFAPIAYACRCWTPQTVRGGANAVNTVMVVRMESIERWPEIANPDFFRGINFVVEKVYKGDVKAGDKAVLANSTRTAQGLYGSSTCHETFGKEYVGKKLLYYGNKPSAGADWFTYTCSRTNFAEARAGDIAWLEKMDTVAGKTRISGWITVNQPRASGEELDSLRGLAGIKIELSGAGKTYALQTDENGVYEIYGLPSGRYSIKISPPAELELRRAFRFADVSPDAKISSEEWKTISATSTALDAENKSAAADAPRYLELYPAGHSGMDFYFKEKK